MSHSCKRFTQSHLSKTQIWSTSWSNSDCLSTTRRRASVEVHFSLQVSHDMPDPDGGLLIAPFTAQEHIKEQLPTQLVRHSSQADLGLHHGREATSSCFTLFACGLASVWSSQHCVWFPSCWASLLLPNTLACNRGPFVVLGT